MKYIKYFESVNSQSVVDLLKSYGFYSEEEINRLLKDSLSDLKNYIDYINDGSDVNLIKLYGLNDVNYFFGRYSNKMSYYGLDVRSTIVDNEQVLRIDMRYSKEPIDVYLDYIRSNFKLVEEPNVVQYPYYDILINLIPENIIYYEIYKYSAGKMKSGDYYKIKPLYPLFKDSYEESLNYSRKLIEDFSIKLHHLRVMYDVGFSYDSNEIDIMILPE